MKIVFKFISFVILFFALILESFAIDSPIGVTVDSKSSSSISLSWDNVVDALGYFIYYSTQSWIENGYDSQSDILETNSYELVGLDSGNTYYISVVALDENWEESDYSEELVIDVVEWEMLTEESETEDNMDINFALESIDVVAYDKLELTFSTPLDVYEEAVREFKITNKNDELDTFEVIDSEINELDDSKLFLTLDRNTEIWNEYDVVIIAITNSDGENIESWIDNSEAFVVSEITEVATEDPIEEPEDEELNSASEEQTWVNWQNLSSEDVENTTLALAENNSKLPDTWAEHILLIVLSIILWTLIFKFKKS